MKFIYRACGMSAKVSSEIQIALDEIKAQKGDTVSVDQIGEVVSSLLETMSGDVSGEEVKIYNHLEGLARYIQHARREIAAINPDEIKDEFIGSAADELDAIVNATEKATGEIMDSVEVVEAVMPELSEESQNKLMDATSKVYEACAFQDITGQRISKVVALLQTIEERINGMVEILGTQSTDAPSSTQHNAKKNDDDPDQSLLNGPQMPENAMGQADIDALLASFD
jgi:chemotaxis protein CheZ